MTRATQALRAADRRRRLEEAARLLPVLGAGLSLLPLLWASHQPISVLWIYCFGLWSALILAAALLTGALQRGEPDKDGAGEAGAPESSGHDL